MSPLQVAVPAACATYAALPCERTLRLQGKTPSNLLAHWSVVVSKLGQNKQGNVDTVAPALRYLGSVGQHLWGSTGKWGSRSGAPRGDSDV